MRFILFLPLLLTLFTAFGQDANQARTTNLGLSTNAVFYKKSYKAFLIPQWEIRKNAHAFSVGLTILVTSGFDASDRKYPKLSGLHGSYKYFPIQASGKLDFYLHTSLLLKRIVDKWSVNYWDDDHSCYELLGYKNTEIIINPFVGYGITLKVLKRLSVTQSIGVGYFLSSIDGKEFDNPSDVDKDYDYRPYGDNGLALEVKLGLSYRFK